MLLAEAGKLCRQLAWGVMLVDEGHRLKNKASRLFQELKAFRCEPGRVKCELV